MDCPRRAIFAACLGETVSKNHVLVTMWCRAIKGAPLSAVPRLGAVAGVSLLSVDLVRYRFAVVEWYATDRSREYQVLTDEGVHKAAWLAGSAFATDHPRTPLRSLRLLSEEAPMYDASGIVVVEEQDLRDGMEWR